MSLLPITSKGLFKGAVVLLGIPGLLSLIIFILFVLIRLVSGTAGGGIGSFSFAVTRRELTMVAGLIVGVIVFLYYLGRALVHDRKRRNPDVTP